MYFLSGHGLGPGFCSSEHDAIKLRRPICMACHGIWSRYNPTWQPILIVPKFNKQCHRNHQGTKIAGLAFRLIPNLSKPWTLFGRRVKMLAFYQQYSRSVDYKGLHAWVVTCFQPVTSLTSLWPILASKSGKCPYRPQKHCPLLNVVNAQLAGIVAMPKWP